MTVLRADYASCNFSELVTDLWPFVKALYSPAKKKRRKRSKVTTTKRGFPSVSSASSASSSAAAGRSHDVSDLHQVEKVSSSATSMDEEGGARREDAEEAGRSGRPRDLRAFPPSPLDFAFFERPMHSEDEAKFQIDWQKRRSMQGAGLAGAMEEEKAEEEAEVDVDAELRLLEEEEEGQDSFQIVSDAKRRTLLISLLVSICRYQVKSRSLKTTYELSLKLATFASDSLMALEKKDPVRNPAADKEQVGKEEEEELLCLRMHLCRLLLMAVTETQFHSDYVATLQRNRVLESCTSALNAALEQDDLKDEREEYRRRKSVLELSACVLHLVDSFHSYSWSWLPRSASLPKRLMGEWSRGLDGFATMEKVFLGLCLKRKDTSPSSGVFLTKLARCIASFCDAQKDELELQPRTAVAVAMEQSHAQLYTTLAKTMVDLPRGEDNSTMLMHLAEAISSSSSAWSFVPTARLWEAALIAIRNCQGAGFSVHLARKLFSLAEAFLEQDEASGDAALTPQTVPGKFLDKPLKHPQDLRQDSVVSDSDSAFYASDISLERCHLNKGAHMRSSGGAGTASTITKEKDGSLTPHVKCYLELMRSDHPDLVLVTACHLRRIVARSARPLRFQILSRVIVPFLEEQTLIPKAAATVDDVPVACESAAGRVVAINELLSLLLQTLPDRDVLSFFQQHKVLKTVMAFRTVPGAVGETYGVLCAFLAAEIEHVMYSEVFQRLSAVGAEVDSSSDDIEHVLTDEEAFQPKFMKALTLTSIVKEFHEILISKTARILDLKSGGKVERVGELQWEELMHVWKTQSVLVRQYGEYQEYAQSKGIPRIVEELFACLADQLPTLEAALTGTFLVPTLGYLLQVMVQFKARRTTDRTNNARGPGKEDQLQRDSNLVVCRSRKRKVY